MGLYLCWLERPDVTNDLTYSGADMLRFNDFLTQHKHTYLTATEEPNFFDFLMGR